MTTNRSDALDLPGLAEDIAADRRTLANVIDQIAAAEPDDAARRHAVSELQSQVMALTAVRRHARATAESRFGSPAAPVVSVALVFQPASLKRQSRSWHGWRVGLPLLVAAAATAVLVVVVVALATAPA